MVSIGSLLVRKSYLLLVGEIKHYWIVMGNG